MENPLNIEEWIVELDIRSMQAAMESGETTSEEIVKAYLKRIERYDGKLKSIIEVNPAAVRIARELDDERYEKGTRGPLHGIPLLLKDNIDTRDALHTSSGSGAAVAANLAAAAIGTETSGSIISPASQQMLVGIKPTVGLVSRSGIIPITHTQDTAGPMARTVADAAILLGAMTGIDERDPATQASAGRFLQDYTPFLDASSLKQARIGIPRHYFRDLDPARKAVLEAAIEALRREGATIIDPVELPCQDASWNGNVLVYEFKKGVNDYLAQLPESIPVHTLAEVIAFNNGHADRCLKYGQDLLEKCEATSGTLTEPEYLETLRYNQEMSRAKGIDYALETYRLDALLFLGCDEGDDIAARAGYPAMTVPGGYAEDGVIAPGGYITKGPVGITFVGTAFSEPTLIKIAYGYEQATRHRVPPDMSRLEEQ